MAPKGVGPIVVEVATVRPGGGVGEGPGRVGPGVAVARPTLVGPEVAAAGVPVAEPDPAGAEVEGAVLGGAGSAAWGDQEPKWVTPAELEGAEVSVSVASEASSALSLPI